MKLIETEHGSLKEYQNVNLWLNFPADQTMNMFLKSIGCSSRQTLESALKQLEDRDHPEKETIRAGVFPKRDIATTTPIPIAWEITDLLKAVYWVYDKRDSREREPFSAEVLNLLVSQQGIVEEDGLEKDYFRMNLLCNNGAQSQLLSSIKPAFQQRMDMINRLVFTSASVADYEMALEYLDNLLAKLIFARESDANELFEKGETACSYSDELLKLYRDLVSVRSTLIPTQADGMPSDVLYFDQSPECADVVSRLEEILRDYKRPVSDKIAREFLECYKEYLCLKIDPEKRDQAVEFAKTFDKISKYIYGTLPKEVFAEEMQKELFSYAKKIFVDLREIGRYGYTRTEYTPKAASDAHFRERLADIQYAIQKNIGEAIKQLRIAYTVFYYSTQINEEGINTISLPPKGTIEMNRLIDCMYYQIYDLSRAVPGMPEIAFDKLDQYADTYNNAVVAMIDCEELVVNELEELLIQMRSREIPDTDRWLATSKLLEYQCKLAVALMVDDSVKKLTDEYDQFCSVIKM